ncbi:MAG TPA: cation:proton antiporter, partial [Gammaproteobacteria bacterium]|nr:cation:proton antiporter [Gammaproteobacteria bacterium]
LFKETTVVTGVSCLLFSGIGAALGWMFGFTWQESLTIGAALMFSSTIIGLRLLPTTVLHHRHTGEIIISILLLQDILAIMVLLGLQARGTAACRHRDSARAALVSCPDSICVAVRALRADHANQTLR